MFSYLLLLFFAGAVLISILAYVVFALDSLIRGQDLPTSDRAIENIGRIISEFKKENGKFYDLGCARGKLAVRLKTKFPDLEVWAIDKSLVRLFFARIRALFWKRKINFLRNDIFRLDLSQADVVYAYLWWDLLPMLEKKLQEELRPGSLIICNTSHLLSWKLKEVRITHPEQPDFEKLFVYIK